MGAVGEAGCRGGGRRLGYGFRDSGIQASSSGAVGAVGSRGGDWSCELLYAEGKRTGALISTIL